MSAFADAVRNSEPYQIPPDANEQADFQAGFNAAFIPKNGLDRGWDKTLPPERDWLMHPLLPAGRVGVLLGSGGAGKTRLALSIAIALATGGGWFGYSASRAGAVLFVGGEDEPDEAHRRLAEIINRLPADVQSLAWKNTYFEARVGTPSLITDVNSITKQVEYTKFLHELAEAAKLVPNLGTIFLDPLSRFRGGEENASQDATRLVEASEWLASETGAAVVLVHHVGKTAAITGTGDSQHAARGSSALVDGVRFAWNLTTLTPAEAKKFGIPEESRRDFAKFSNSKNNYARRFDDLFFDMRGEVRQMVAPGTGNSRDTDAATLTKIKTIIEDKAKLGIRFTRRSFVDHFAGINRELGLSKASLDLIIQEAGGRGDLITHQKRGGKGLELYLPGEMLTEGANDETL